jgi:hypothetical protein
MQVRWVPGSLWLGLDFLLYVSLYYTCCLRAPGVFASEEKTARAPGVRCSPQQTAMDTWGSSRSLYPLALSERCSALVAVQ